ncbi:hypothetical protein OH76DRAFT_1405139 [Lentinus brumalis]|uniref:Uncharacterized protein n=1 Tax=Lentinus brumalis TaxID=2498619 RepID=A0A371D6Q0_9APHY|nr:hypothetical protein OH76DRAFT_1405139 [Polyporus brumalis]
MSAESEPTRPTEVRPTPAPWTVKAEAWWFITSIGHRPEPGETLPISYFPSQETQLYKTSTAQEAFRGGRGSVTLLRYTDTPIGPFDELAISPGEFTNPFEQECHRITRAYASSIAAVVNGRSNWGLPRELAQFTFTPSLDHPDATEVRVYPAISFSPVEFSSDPCFAALIKPVSWLPAIPASLAHFPHVKLFQPPLEGSPHAAYDGLVAAPKWHVLDCEDYRGRAKLFRCEGLLKPKQPELTSEEDGQRRRIAHKIGFTDDIAFPDVAPYRLGIHWTEIEVTLPQAVPLATL